MQKIINSMHRQMHYCANYQKFLIDKQQTDKSYRWNWQFFFTSIVWLINYKMYKEFFLFTFGYLSLTSFFIGFYDSNFELAIPMISGIYMVIHVLLSFFSHNLYYNHLEIKFYKVNYDMAKCEKIAKPYPYIVTLCLFVLISLLTIFCFNIIHNINTVIKDII